MFGGQAGPMQPVFLPDRMCQWKDSAPHCRPATCALNGRATARQGTAQIRSAAAYQPQLLPLFCCCSQVISGLK